MIGRAVSAVSCVVLGLHVLSLLVTTLRFCLWPQGPTWYLQPPTDNAFDDYVDAAALVDRRGVPPYEWLGPEADSTGRIELARRSRDIIKAVHRATDKSCVVTLHDSPDPMPVLAGVTCLAHFLGTVAYGFHDMDRSDEAVQVATDGVVMTIGMERGTYRDAGTSMVAGNLVLGALDHVAASASAIALQNACWRLVAADARTPDLSEIEAATEYWIALGDRAERRYKQELWGEGVEGHHSSWQAERRAVIAKLAALAYEKEHGALPADLDSLVPAYLDAVPRDPLSERPLKYRTTRDGFVVYSVGPDGSDNGGRPQRTHRDDAGDICAGVPASAYRP